MRPALALLLAALVNLALFVVMERMVGGARGARWEAPLETLTLALVAAPETRPAPELAVPEPKRRDAPEEPALPAPAVRVPPLTRTAAPKFARVVSPAARLETFGAPSLASLEIEAPVAVAPLEPNVHVEPRYPRRALSRGIEGRVVVAYTIQPDGSTSDLEVVEAEPPKIFDRSALEAVRQWRFAPQPEPRRETVPIEFELAR
jgi:protein TonB